MPAANRLVAVVALGAAPSSLVKATESSLRHLVRYAPSTSASRREGDAVTRVPVGMSHAIAPAADVRRKDAASFVALLASTPFGARPATDTAIGRGGAFAAVRAVAHEVALGMRMSDATQVRPRQTSARSALGSPAASGARTDRMQEFRPSHAGPALPARQRHRWFRARAAMIERAGLSATMVHERPECRAARLAANERQRHELRQCVQWDGHRQHRGPWAGGLGAGPRAAYWRPPHLPTAPRPSAGPARTSSSCRSPGRNRDSAGTARGPHPASESRVHPLPRNRDTS